MNGVNAKTVEVLVTGGNVRSALCVARSLARRGVPLMVVGEARVMALRSRYVKHALVSPSPRTERRAYFEFVLDVVKKYDIQLVLPVADIDVEIFHEYRSELEEHTTLGMASQDAIRNVLDKRVNLKLASELGIPVPKQFELESPDQIPEMIEQLGLPVVMKTPGPTFDDQKPLPFRFRFAHDEQQLRGFVDEYCTPNAVRPLFQECATGKVHNLCCFAVKGELTAIHEYHSVRRYSGAGVLRRVVGLLPEMREHAARMLGALEWDGVAHIGFFMGHDGKKKWYMETNGRYWASVQGSVHAGWDFPWWVYRYFRHGETPSPGPIREGSLTCWHRGDLEAWIQFVRGGEIPATGTNPSRVGAFFQYLSGFNPRIKSDVLSWGDPMPGIIDHWDYFKSVMEGRRKKRKRG